MVHDAQGHNADAAALVDAVRWGGGEQPADGVPAGEVRGMRPEILCSFADSHDG